VMSTITALPTEHAKPPIGRPLPNTRAYLLDQELTAVPEGEIHLAGAGLARGYHRRPALTASRFIPNPFEGDGSRLYRTGDLARLLPDGNLDFQGRNDQQLKIRGHRIEPGEVESALTGHPRVRNAVVVGHEGRLIAYLVPDGPPPGSQELRVFLGTTLPDHMVPAQYVEIASIPLTTNGKRDLAALPTPSALRQAVHVAPATPTEQVVAEIWTELFGLDRVGATDRFFDLGGHSLLAIRAIAAIRRRFGIGMTAEQFYGHATVRALAGLVEEHILAEIEQMSENEARESLDAPQPHRGDSAR
ncbi:non-ribosomal peptide synthetase, partial [Micromonospora chersina]|uniref:non-ribosomal peptide synthetase n=1 Tax=Micromonospora chersina TaxID=47854 RepID=UPI00371E02E0